MILVSIANAAATPPPIQIDPRACGLCGLTVDKHDMVDTGEGPLFYCIDFDPNDLTLIELERREVLRFREEVAAMIEQWERADPRDAWMHTGEAPPPDSIRNGPQTEPCRQSNRPAQSTIDAFLHLAQHDRGRLAAWLANHPQDVGGELFKLWESKS
jgi:hypothetical protein